MPPSGDGGPLLLGIDVGTTRTKALVLDQAGTEVAVAVRGTPFAAGPAGVEARVDDLLAAVAGVLGDLAGHGVLDRSGDPGDRGDRGDRER